MQQTLITILLMGMLWVCQAQSATAPQVRSGSPAEASHPASSKDYVGSEGCRSCHQAIYESYTHTAHYRASQAPTAESIAGSFAPGNNTFATSNPELSFRMDATAHGFSQTAISGVPPDTESRTESIDLVIGSGRKGQTYLFWKANELFQLPISYWTELNQWVNSPGYRDGTADFSRRVPPRCLECHATFFKTAPPPINRYDRSDSVLGLSCEKCHGPGRAHVTHEQAKQPTSSDSYLVNPAKLTPDRQTDLCALCHAGLGEPARAPAFSFSPGGRIDDYLTFPSASDRIKIDVHGSQVELLRRSRCFRESKTMTCLTCHNVHVMQRDAALFSSRCLSCHKVASCGLYPQRGDSLADNCVDCHMPKQPTDLIVSDSNGKKVRPEVRNHQIKVYEAQSK